MQVQLCKMFFVQNNKKNLTYTFEPSSVDISYQVQPTYPVYNKQKYDWINYLVHVVAK